MSRDKGFRRARTAELFAETLGQNWRGRVAAALDMDASAVRRMFAPPAGRDDAPSLALLSVAECLAILPPDQWPPQWRDTDDR